MLKAPLPAFASIVRHTERTEWELYECNICHGKSQENFRYFHIVVDFWVTEKDKGVMTVRATCSLSPSFILATLIASFLLPPFSPLCFLFPPPSLLNPLPSLPSSLLAEASTQCRHSSRQSGCANGEHNQHLCLCAASVQRRRKGSVF